MRADILRMDKFPKSSRHDWEAEAKLAGFTKALGVVHGLSGLRTAEQRTAIENWSAAECGKLTREERDALMEFYGWDRAP
jgi:hypothetical protein